MSDKNVYVEELEAMRKRMEELFLRNVESEPNVDGPDTEWGPDADAWAPLADIMDSGEELLYVLDLPGVLDQDLQVECRADLLWVHGTRREDVPAGAALGTERPMGAFSRIFKLPCPIREDAIRAEFKKGVLRITVPKECTTGTRIQKVPVRIGD